MASAELAPTFLSDSFSTSPETDRLPADQSRPATDGETDYSPEMDAHSLWLQQAIVERIGTILADEGLDADEREASLGGLRQLTSGAGVGTLAFRSLVSFARHDLQLKRQARRTASQAGSEAAIAN